MADNNKKNISIFAGIIDALNSNKRKKSTIDPEAPGMGTTQSMPSISPKGGVEQMQQQFFGTQK